MSTHASWDEIEDALPVFRRFGVEIELSYLPGFYVVTSTRAQLRINEAQLQYILDKIDTNKVSFCGFGKGKLDFIWTED